MKNKKNVWIKSVMGDLVRSVRLTLLFCIVLAVGYVLVLWLFARVAGPNGGRAEVSLSGGLKSTTRIVGATLVGQRFTSDRYFWGRPSSAGAQGYDASASAGSNKGPTNEKYLSEVAERRDSFLRRHSYLRPSDVPAEMLTASGSGLDPDISPESAYIQVKRVATARRLSVETVRRLVDRSVESPLLGIMGTAKVNVLLLNLRLDEITRSHGRI